MTTRPLRTRAKAAALAVCGIAAIAAAIAASVPAMAARQSEPAIGATAASVPVVIDCAGQLQVRPGQYILACGGLHHLPATATYPLSQFGGA